MQFVVVDLQETVLNLVLAAKSALSRIYGLCEVTLGVVMCVLVAQALSVHTPHTLRREVAAAFLLVGRPPQTVSGGNHLMLEHSPIITLDVGQ